MITKNELKYYSSLLQKKFRNEEHKFMVEGEKNVLEGLKSSWQPEIIFITNELCESNPDICDYFKSKARTEVLKHVEFYKLSDTVTPQGILAVFRKMERELNPPDLKSPVIAALDNVADPGNVGTIIRTCDWFGINDLILGSGCADLYNSKTLRSAMGSEFHINIYENVSLPDVLPELKSSGYKVVSADTDGENIFRSSLPAKMILVFSNEANGPSDFIKENREIQVTIPGKGQAESLNVSAAAAIVLSEIFRRSQLS